MSHLFCKLLPLLLLMAQAPSVLAQEVLEESQADYDFEHFLETVEKVHPISLAADAGVQQLDAKLSQAKWAYFPSFELSGTATITPEITGNPLEFHSTWDKVGIYGSVKLDMVQPIWTFGKIEQLKKAAQLGLESAEAAKEIALWELRVRAAQAWFGRLLSLELSSILDDGQVWIEKAEKHMDKQRLEDSIDYDQMEHLRLKTRVAEFWELAANNERLKTQSLEGIRILLQENPGVKVPIQAKNLEPYELDLLDGDAYVELMNEHDPILRAIRSKAKAQEALAKSKANELYPDLFLAGQIGISRATAIEDQHSPFANDPFNRRFALAGLGIRWKLDVPQRLFKRDEARAEARRSHYEAMVQSDLQELKVRDLAVDLANKQKLLDIYARSQRSAQGWLTAAWDTYDAGFGNFRDVMDALVQFYEKKFMYLQLVFEYNTLSWKLSQAIGLDIRSLKNDKATLPSTPD